VAGLLGGLGLTYALWQSEAKFEIGPINHGELKLGAPERTWQFRNAQGVVIAADKDDPAAASLPAAAKLDGLTELKTPCGTGAVLEVTDTYPLSFEGDTLTAALKISWDGGQASPAGGDRFAVLDQGRTKLADGDIGSTTSAAITPGTTGLVVVQTYQLPQCDAFAEGSALYGDHVLEVAQL
jgi:alternate signal-mediated exported protein